MTQQCYWHNREERCDVTKIKICKNYGIGWHIQKERDEKCPLAKNQPVSANWWGDISNVVSSHQSALTG